MPFKNQSGQVMGRKTLLIDRANPVRSIRTALATFGYYPALPGRKPVKDAPFTLREKNYWVEGEWIRGVNGDAYPRFHLHIRDVDQLDWETVRLTLLVYLNPVVHDTDSTTEGVVQCLAEMARIERAPQQIAVG